MSLFKIVVSMEKSRGIKRSFLWNYFTVKDAEQKLCKCDLCKQILCYKSTITNLKKHMVRRHPTINLKAHLTNTNRESESESELNHVPTTSEPTYSIVPMSFKTDSFEEPDQIESKDKQSNIEIEYQSERDDPLEYTQPPIDELLSTSSNDAPVFRKTNFRKLAPKVISPGEKIIKNRKKGSTDSAVEQARDTAVRVGDKCNKDAANEVDCFGKLVACKLKKLPESVALESMAYIHSYLVKQQLKQMPSQ
ncbi:uncharacterized protein LOC109541682 [Dendroctonus ponderosae]|uniref:BED-type domain-containing protein n=1 Tax=Dendroctonus ponderosae TaxID=77166 RepID=U4UA10_DENPD|nr:uncharacterized protein LOC109541682 [Dendroctonus ponderosae]ERL87416.1 hypothetical protein D910_04811 [Dendroctonus ponderosae]KAH1004421.1 hypothetical protein HUJ05_005234 [Dendroctonus ponderosae]